MHRRIPKALGSQQSSIDERIEWETQAKQSYQPENWSNNHGASGMQSYGMNHSSTSLSVGNNNSNQYNYISSDDSSDDEELVSKTSGASRITIHREKNGIWVSSDEEDEEKETEDRYSMQRKQSVLMNGTKHGSWNGQARGHVSDFNSGSTRRAGSHQNILRRALSIDPHFSNSVDYSNPRKSSPASTWSSGSSTTTSSGPHSHYWSSGSEHSPRNRTQYSRRSSANEPVARPRKPNQNLGSFSNRSHNRELRNIPGYESFESVSLSSDNENGGYGSSASAGSRISGYARLRNPNNALGRSSSFRMPKQVINNSSTISSSTLETNIPTFYMPTSHQWTSPQYSSESTSLQTPTWKNHTHTRPLSTCHQRTNTSSTTCSSSTATSAHPVLASDGTIQLHAVQFWDPTGTKAKYAEWLIQLVGFGFTLGVFSFGQFFWCLVSLILTVLCSSYFSAMFRLLRWRDYSGIEHKALFNDLYELVEGVATDTRMAMPTGEMKPRLICAAELGNVIRKHAPMLDEQTQLRFWVEACAHFRLTLRNGCHHLGHGKLLAKSLTTASLAMYSHSMPTAVCSSCDNKVAIESKFPLKCD